MQRQNDQIYDQLIESPYSIEEFIQKQYQYREIYLTTDREIER